jgi:hypothetical protein
VRNFVQNLVLRAAGLATGASARPPFQPSFAPDLPTGRRAIAPPGPAGSAPAGRDPATAEVTAEILATAGALAEPGLPMAPEVEARMADLPRGEGTPPPQAGDTGEQPPAPPRRLETGPVLGPLPATAPALAVWEEEALDEPPVPRPLPVEAPTPAARVDRPADEPPMRRPASEPPAGPPPRAARDRPVPKPPLLLPLAADVPTDRQVAMARQVPDPGTGDVTTASSRPAISPERPPATERREAGQPAATGPAVEARTGPMPAREAEPLSLPPLVRPAATPPGPRLATGPAAEQPATMAEAGPAVQVRIGTVEIQASHPAPPALPRPRPQPTGFDDYAHLRGMEWE